MRSDTGAIATSVNLVADARDASLKSWWPRSQGEVAWTMSPDAPDRESTAAIQCWEVACVALFLRTAPSQEPEVQPLTPGQLWCVQVRIFVP